VPYDDARRTHHAVELGIARIKLVVCDGNGAVPIHDPTGQVPSRRTIVLLHPSRYLCRVCRRPRPSQFRRGGAHDIRRLATVAALFHHPRSDQVRERRCDRVGVVAKLARDRLHVEGFSRLAA
jgi:hypothetical protein